MNHPREKIKTLSEIAEISEEAKSQGITVVTTNGSFDILHPGHILNLYEAKKAGGENSILIVGMNSDSSVRGYKGPKRPINSQEDRAVTLSGMEYVDYVTIFEERLPNRFLEAVKPNIHCKGGEYTRKTMPEWEVVERFGGRVHLIEMRDGYSTTSVVEKLKKE